MEDGQFTLFATLSDTEMYRLQDRGITIEAHFYLDFEIEDGSVLRIFADRQSIDRVQADFGRLPRQDGEILLEKRYASEHGISIDDTIQIQGCFFNVCGIGSSPDYEAPYRHVSDSVIDSSRFGTGFVGEPDYQMLKKMNRSIQAEEYTYAYLLGDETAEAQLKEALRDSSMPDNFDVNIPKLIQYLPAEDNIRIGSAAADVVINKSAGLLAGVVLIVLFAYVM